MQEGGDSCIRCPLVDDVCRYVGEIEAVACPHRAFRPCESGGDAFKFGVSRDDVADGWIQPICFQGHRVLRVRVARLRRSRVRVGICLFATRCHCDRSKEHHWKDSHPSHSFLPEKPTLRTARCLQALTIRATLEIQRHPSISPRRLTVKDMVCSDARLRRLSSAFCLRVCLAAQKSAGAKSCSGGARATQEGDADCDVPALLPLQRDGQLLPQVSS